MKFINKNSSHSTLHIGHKEKYIEETVKTKFLGLQIDNYINWKNHIEQMTPQVSEACYANRSVVRISNINMIQYIYYAYFNSIIKYGKIFGGISFPTVGRLSLYKRKSSDLWLIHNP